MMKMHRSAARWLVAFALVAGSGTPSLGQSMERDGYVLPPASVQELFRRDKNIATLDRLSPDGDHFLVPKFQELTDLKLMSQRTLRLAMLELVPAVNREWRLATYGNDGAQPLLAEGAPHLSDQAAGGRVRQRHALVAGRQPARVRRASADRVAGVGGRRERPARREAVSDAPVMATLVARPGGGGEAPETAAGRLLQWMPDGSLLTVIVPPNRGPEPQEPAVPAAPIIRRSRDKETPTTTQPFLLRTPNDERLFKYYTTAQLAIVGAGRAPRPIGAPMMYLDYWVSPDGKCDSARELDEPLSYLPVSVASAAGWK